MTEQQIAIYLFDLDTGEYNGSRLVPKNYGLQPGETFTKPKEGLYEPRIHHGDPASDDDTWTGSTAEEFNKTLPDKKPVQPVQPNGQQALIMGQQANIVQLQKTVMNQQSKMTEMQKTVMDQQSNMVQMQKLIMTQQAQLTELKKGSN